jgi:hypothetical protein
MSANKSAQSFTNPRSSKIQATLLKGYKRGLDPLSPIEIEPRLLT